MNGIAAKVLDQNLQNQSQIHATLCDEAVSIRGNSSLDIKPQTPYKDMCHTRHLEEEAAKLYPLGTTGTVPRAH